MEINSTRPATEIASVAAAVPEQADRFNQRKTIEAHSDVKNEAVFFSPVVRIDKDTHSTVIQYRDPNTGEVTKEYPHKDKVSAYEHAQDTTKAASSSDNARVIKVISDDAPKAKEAAPVKAPEKAPEPKAKDPVVDEQA